MCRWREHARIRTRLSVRWGQHLQCTASLERFRTWRPTSACTSMGAHIRRGLVCCSEKITDGSMDVEQPAAAAKKAPEPEEDEDMGFSLFD